MINECIKNGVKKSFKNSIKKKYLSLRRFIENLQKTSNVQYTRNRVAPSILNLFHKQNAFLSRIPKEQFLINGRTIICIQILTVFTQRRKTCN